MDGLANESRECEGFWWLDGLDLFYCWTVENLFLQDVWVWLQGLSWILNYFPRVLTAPRNWTALQSFHNTVCLLNFRIYRATWSMNLHYLATGMLTLIHVFACKHIATIAPFLYWFWNSHCNVNFCRIMEFQHKAHTTQIWILPFLEWTTLWKAMACRSESDGKGFKGQQTRGWEASSMLIRMTKLSGTVEVQRYIKKNFVHLRKIANNHIAAAVQEPVCSEFNYQVKDYLEAFLGISLRDCATPLSCRPQ